MPGRKSYRSEVTVSSKRRITIPLAIAKKLGVKPGSKLVASVEAGSIVLRLSPSDWFEYVTSGRHVPTWGRTKEEVDAYIRDVRRGWDCRARIAEGGSYIEEVPERNAVKENPA